MGGQEEGEETGRTLKRVESGGGLRHYIGVKTKRPLKRGGIMRKRVKKKKILPV